MLIYLSPAPAATLPDAAVAAGTDLDGAEFHTGNIFKTLSRWIPVDFCSYRPPPLSTYAWPVFRLSEHGGGDNDDSDDNGKKEAL